MKKFTERQQQIVETAIKLIADKGIQNLTTKNLAEEIGISEPAIYRHFSNKLEILKAVITNFQIKMKPALVDTPVVFLSAKGQETEIEIGMDAGAEEYLLKPFSPDELTLRVSKILAKFGK